MLSPRVWPITGQIRQSPIIMASKCRSSPNILIKKAGFAWNLQPLRHSVQCNFKFNSLFLVFISPNDISISQVRRGELNMMQSLKPLTIKFKDNFFHNSMQWSGFRSALSWSAYPTIFGECSIYREHSWKLIPYFFQNYVVLYLELYQKRENVADIIFWCFIKLKIELSNGKRTKIFGLPGQTLCP